MPDGDGSCQRGRGALTPAEWERVRLHPYLSERMLAASRALAPFAPLAAHHHEPLDGSGYPRGLSGAALSSAARILGAADVYHAATEPRPHRPAHTPEHAAAELRAESRPGVSMAMSSRRCSARRGIVSGGVARGRPDLPPARSRS